MANKKYEETDIQAIADTIREKTGNEDSYKVSEMASGVNEVYSKGSADGWAEFLTLLTNSGKRGIVNRLFCETDFTGKTFNPIWYPRYLGSMFYNYYGKELPSGIDCSKAEKNETSTDHGVCPVLFVAYCYSLEEFPDIGIKPYKDLTQMFRQCTALKTIGVLRVFEDTTYSNTFYYSSALKYIRFEGIIGRDISFAQSPLDIDSLKDIITHLKNYTGLTDNSGNSLEMKYTLTLKDSCRTELEAASFTDEDKRVLEENGVTVVDETTWTSVIGDLKWNLVWATA